MRNLINCWKPLFTFLPQRVTIRECPDDKHNNRKTILEQGDLIGIFAELDDLMIFNSFYIGTDIHVYTSSIFEQKKPEFVRRDNGETFFNQNLYMKYSAIVYLFLLIACGSNLNEEVAKLMNEQKLLKDSANNLTESIGDYIRRGVNDSAEAQKIRVEVLHARLIDIQSSLDSLAKKK